MLSSDVWSDLICILTFVFSNSIFSRNSCNSLPRFKDCSLLHSTLEVPEQKPSWPWLEETNEGSGSLGSVSSLGAMCWGFSVGICGCDKIWTESREFLVVVDFVLDSRIRTSLDLKWVWSRSRTATVLVFLHHFTMTLTTLIVQRLCDGSSLTLQTSSVSLVFWINDTNSPSAPLHLNWSFDMSYSKYSTNFSKPISSLLSIFIPEPLEARAIFRSFSFSSSFFSWFTSLFMASTSAFCWFWVTFWFWSSSRHVGRPSPRMNLPTNNFAIVQRSQVIPRNGERINLENASVLDVQFDDEWSPVKHPATWVVTTCQQLESVVAMTCFLTVIAGLDLPAVVLHKTSTPVTRVVATCRQSRICGRNNLFLTCHNWSQYNLKCFLGIIRRDNKSNNNNNNHKGSHSSRPPRWCCLETLH